MAFFDEVLEDGPFGDKELNIAFLRKHGYGVKNVFGGIRGEHFDYFDSLINKDGNNGYRVHHAYHIFTIDEAWECAFDNPAANIIIEFIGRDFFAFMSEIDSYQLFGAKDQLKKIDDKRYSDDYAKEVLNTTNDEDAKRYYQWLYDTYQHL